MLFVLGVAAGIFFLSASLALGIALKQFFGALSMPMDIATQIERDVHNLQGSVPTALGTNTSGYTYIPQPAPYNSVMR
ncbi:MAG: hypothetical protein RL094_578 [Candidatus Parcubacteria bacterium]